MLADVAVRSHGQVELSIRPKADVPPAVHKVLGQLFDCDRLFRAGQLGLDIIESDDAVDLCDIKRSILEGHAIGIVQALCNDIDLACLSMVVIILIHNGIKSRAIGRIKGLKWAARSHIERSLGA